jgi:hypothetical protein
MTLAIWIWHHKAGSHSLCKCILHSIVWICWIMTRDSVGTHVCDKEWNRIYIYNWLEPRSDQKEKKILQIWFGSNSLCHLRCGERQHTQGELKNSHNLLVKDRIPCLEFCHILQVWPETMLFLSPRFKLVHPGSLFWTPSLMLSSSLVFLSWPLGVFEAPWELSFPSVHRSRPSPI